MAKRKKKELMSHANKISICIVGAVMLVVSIALGVQYVNLSKQSVAYAQQEDIYNTLIEDEQTREESLENQMDYVQTKQYIEEIAKSKLNLVYPDEYVFVQGSEK